MTRRMAFTSATAFSILKPAVAFGSQANSKISVGLLGVGGRGTYDAQIVHQDPRARITALCDKFPDRIEAGTARLKLENPATSTDYQKFLSSSSIDAVVIATPPFEHPPMLEAAVEAKKHIYCEKPMGVDLAGCKRVIAAGRKAEKSKCLSVGFQQRYGPVYLEAYKRIQEGQIGELSTARGFWISNDPFVRRPYDDPKVEKLRNWFCYKEYSGDFIVEQDCHNLDVLHWFLGAVPVRAVGYGGRKVRTSMDLLDNLSLTYEFPNGMNVNFEANQLTPRGFSRVGEEFTGTKGTLLTSRSRMTHVKGPNDEETITSKRDITYDGMENFLTRIETNTPENVAERSALSTLIAILGRTALYERREATWKKDIGV
jgi:myo-inositol 2-dehydrogenase / D-chiro-inositol 1-dehydrogenase